MPLRLYLLSRSLLGSQIACTPKTDGTAIAIGLEHNDDRDTVIEPPLLCLPELRYRPSELLLCRCTMCLLLPHGARVSHARIAHTHLPLAPRQTSGGTA